MKYPYSLAAAILFVAACAFAAAWCLNGGLWWVPFLVTSAIMFGFTHYALEKMKAD